MVIAVAPITAVLVGRPLENPLANVAWGCYCGWFSVDQLVGQHWQWLFWPFAKS